MSENQSNCETTCESKQEPDFKRIDKGINMLKVKVDSLFDILAQISPNRPTKRNERETIPEPEKTANLSLGIVLQQTPHNIEYCISEINRFKQELRELILE